jgi:hypothetical protein
MHELALTIDTYGRYERDIGILNQIKYNLSKLASKHIQKTELTWLSKTNNPS